MSPRQDVLSGFAEERLKASFVDSGGWRSGGGVLHLTSRPVVFRELLVVEMPLLLLLTILFMVTLLVAPGQSITLLGFNLPSLLFCPFFELSGVPCLMCGITRSFLSMGGGDIGRAFIFHPLGPLFYLTLIVAYLALVISVLLKRRIRINFDRNFRWLLAGAGTAILVVAWLVKVVIWHQVGLL